MNDALNYRFLELDTLSIIEGEEPWGDWLEAVGIDSAFPYLEALQHPFPDHDALGSERPNADSRRWFVNRPHALQVGQIYRSLHAARVVTTAPGHGATTLARYLYLRAESDALLRRSIPVLISFEDLIQYDYATLVDFEREALLKHQRFMAADGHLGLYPRSNESDADFLDRRRKWAEDMMEEADRRAKTVFSGLTPDGISERIGTAVRDAVIRSLVTESWESAMTRAKYRDLINADSPQSRDLQRKRQELARFVPEGPLGQSSLEMLREKAPALVPDDHRQLVARLNQTGAVRISLLLDLSATPAGRFCVDEHEGEYLTIPYQDALAKTAIAIKNLEQLGDRADVNPPLPSLLDKTYFMSRRAWPIFQSTFTEQAEEIIDFPSYRPIDVFAMLAYHYPPHQDDSGRRAEALAAIVDSRYVKISENRALSTEMARLQATLRHNVALNGDLTYQIDPVTAKTITEDVLPEILEAVIRLADLARANGSEDPVADLKIRRLRDRYPIAREPGGGEDDSAYTDGGDTDG